MNCISRDPASRLRRTRWRLAILVPIAAALASACGSSSTSIVSPTAQKCQISVIDFTRTFGASGGTGTARIGAARECSWTAASRVPWISISSSANGVGDGTVSFTVSANQASQGRSGALLVNDEQLTVSQEGAPCRFSVTSTNPSVPAEGGTVTVNVGAPAGCAWTASTQTPWLRVSAGGGSGNGNVSIVVASNAGTSRSGTAVVAGQTVTIDQAGVSGPPPPGCQVAVSPTQLTFPAEGGAASIRVTVSSGCAWQATASASWMTVSPSGGTKSDSVTVGVAPNSGPARSGTVSVGGQTVSVTQAGAGVAPVTLSGVVSRRRGDCPSLTFLVGDTWVETNAGTEFVNRPCDKVKNDTRVTVEGVRAADRVLATRVTVADD